MNSSPAESRWNQDTALLTGPMYILFHLIEQMQRENEKEKSVYLSNRLYKENFPLLFISDHFLKLLHTTSKCCTYVTMEEKKGKKRTLTVYLSFIL